MSISPAFLKGASDAIENEVHTYFPDTALYRRLCWGGPCDAHLYMHREFSPNPTQYTQQQQPDGDAVRANETVVISGPPVKRQRRSLLDELESTLRSMNDVASRTVGSLDDHQFIEKGTVPSVHAAPSLAGIPSTPARHPLAPFTVTCRRCTTRIVSTYPCRVIDGYVVLWAESVLDVDCATAAGQPRVVPFMERPLAATTPTLKTDSTGRSESAKSSGGSSRGRETNSGAEVTTAKSSRSTADEQPPSFRPSGHSHVVGSYLPRLGLRPLPHRQAPEEHEKQGKTHKATATASKKKKKQGASSVATPTQDGAISATFTPVVATLQVTLHSLHLVSIDAVTTPRPMSFALQSILQPGMPTALELYTRHMIHFGLTCFAAWRASPQQWRVLMGFDDEASGNGKAAHLHASHEGNAKSRRRGAAAAAAKRLRNESCTGSACSTESALRLSGLLPQSSDDAVLVLGLGGNVLGECLDAVLPPAVPLHIVEVEPAVLQACEEHHQFPPCAVPNTATLADESGTSPSSSGKVDDGRKSSRSGAKAKASSPTPTPDVWSTAAKLIQQKKETCVAFSSERQWCKSDVRSRGDENGISAKIVPAGKSGSRDRSDGVKKGDDTRGEYVTFLQDAYVFLRGVPQTISAAVSKAAPARASSKRSQGTIKATARKNSTQAASASQKGVTLQASAENPRRSLANTTESPSACSSQTRTSSVAVTAVTPVQYSMIFLDCYDPDRERMMHEGRLIELCARRLRPGGVLLVNAHVLPTASNLERDFASHGFATVQALRVAGCTQSVLVCVAPDAPAGSSEVDGEALAEAKCTRYTVHQLQRLANELNKGNAFSSVASVSKRETGFAAALSSSPEHSSQRFVLDASWLQSCRRESLTKQEGKTPRSKGGRKIEAPDFRVWQHFS